MWIHPTLAGGKGMKERNCDHCAKFSNGYDRYTGTDLSDCPEWDTMTDEEVEASNRGECPRFVEIDWEAVRADEEAMYESWVELEGEG